MSRIIGAVANFFNRPTSSRAVQLVAVALATACSEGGVTVPPPTASQSPTLGAAMANDASAGESAGIFTGALTHGGNFSVSLTVAGQPDHSTCTATAGPFPIIAMG